MQFVDDGKSHSESLPRPCRNSTCSCTKCSEAPFRYFCLWPNFRHNKAFVLFLAEKVENQKKGRGRRWKEFQPPQEMHSSRHGLRYILPGCPSTFLFSLWPKIFFCLVHQCPAKYILPPQQCGVHCTVLVSQLWSFSRFSIFITCCSLLTMLKELLIIVINFSYSVLRSELN